MKNKLLHYCVCSLLALLLFGGSQSLLAQQAPTKKEVHGSITDSTGAPIPGAAVVVKEQRGIGTISDENGKYILDVPLNATLEYRLMGYKPQLRPVAGKTVINVVLSANSNDLSDVVVVAYGTQKRESMVSAITTISPKELKIPGSNLTTALAGRVSGIIGFQRSAEPGHDNAQFFIRGVTTFGYKKDPLILIDGIEVSATDLARMQPDDMASFSVLKDATATAPYGARGANGIIAITTKEGKEGKSRFMVRLENSLSTPIRNVKLADPATYMRMENEAVNSRYPLQATPYSQEKIDNTVSHSDPYLYPSVNWYDMLFNKYTMNQRVNMNLSGGTKVANYFISGSYSQDNGILKVDHRNNFNNNSSLKTYELRSNINIHVTPTTQFEVRLIGTFDNYNGPINGASEMYDRVMRASPVDFPAYYDPGHLYSYVQHIMFGNSNEQGAQYNNPYAALVRGYHQSNTSNMEAQADIKQDLASILKGLDARVKFNTTRYASAGVSRAYNPYYYHPGLYDETQGGYTLVPLNTDGTEYLSASFDVPSITTTTYLEAALDYAHTFGKYHNVTGLLVGSLRNSQQGYVASNTDVQQTLPFRNEGISGRFTYDFNSRFLAEFSFGFNGSERFYKTNRFGFFPAGGIGYYISNEKFWEPLMPIIPKLKVRATYGMVGNDAIGSPSDRFFFLSDVNLNDGNYGSVFGKNLNNSSPGVSINRYQNLDITWEKAVKTDIGIEMSLFKDWQVEADYFREVRSNILQTRPNPATMGLEADVQANVGKAESNGIDASVVYNKTFNKDLWLSIRANFTYAHNKYLVYEEPDYLSSPLTKTLSHVGQSIDQQYGLIAERLFVDDKEAANAPKQNYGSYMGGDIKYRDVNGDGQITDNDKVPLGLPTTPEITYGFGFSLGYKNFDLSSFFQGLGRESFWIDYNSVTPFYNYGTYNYSPNQLLQVIADNHWTEDKRNLYALWPRLTPDGYGNNSITSNWFMRNGAFLRLKQAEIGYTLPRYLMKKWRMETARFYLNGSNLLTLSKFKLWDPEMGGNGFAYPIQRVFNLGIQLNF